MFSPQLDTRAVNAILKPLFGGGGIDAQVALGAYDVLGYALGQVFGPDVAYQMMSGDTPGDVANVLSQAPPEVQAFMDFTNREGKNLAGAAELPPWMVPFIKQAVQVLLQKLFERFGAQESPQLFGVKLTRNLPQETGGAFPERGQGVPSGTGLFTTSRTSQASGAQAQPSPNIQQPTGHTPELHTSVPQSSKSPQFQGNTADPNNPPLVKDGGSPTGPITNDPGVPGTPPNPNLSPTKVAGTVTPQQAGNAPGSGATEKSSPPSSATGGGNSNNATGS